jgi:hypothetical protein
VTGRYWEDQGCSSCRDLETLAEGLQAALDNQDDEVDTLTIQLHVCRTELAAANYARGQERQRADDFERRLNMLLEERDS